MAERERIVVELPLPVDVAVRLMQAIDEAFPGATLVVDPEGRESVMVFEVERPRYVDDLDVVD